MNGLFTAVLFFFSILFFVDVTSVENHARVIWTVPCFLLNILQIKPSNFLSSFFLTP